MFQELILNDISQKNYSVLAGVQCRWSPTQQLVALASVAVCDSDCSLAVDACARLIIDKNQSRPSRDWGVP